MRRHVVSLPVRTVPDTDGLGGSLIREKKSDGESSGGSCSGEWECRSLIKIKDKTKLMPNRI